MISKGYCSFCSSTGVVLRGRMLGRPCCTRCFTGPNKIHWEIHGALGKKERRDGTQVQVQAQAEAAWGRTARETEGDLTLEEMTPAELEEHYGKNGSYFSKAARGVGR